MIRLTGWNTTVTSLGLLWYECGDDFGLFCYRIGCGAFVLVRSRALALAPVSQAMATSIRKNDECSNLSFTCSALSTTPMDSRN